MTYYLRLGILALGSAVSVAACSSILPGSGDTTNANAVVLAKKVTVKGVSTTILTDKNGRTLYWYTGDVVGRVTCTGSCQALWPPLTVPSGVKAPTGGSGVTGKITTIPLPVAGNQGDQGNQTNQANQTIVVYNHWPLYRFAQDTAPGKMGGDGRSGRWFIATPDLAP